MYYKKTFSRHNNVKPRKFKLTTYFKVIFNFNPSAKLFFAKVGNMSQSTALVLADNIMYTFVKDWYKIIQSINVQVHQA